ncbi:18854_t:CDS:2, partial [Funneliformis geosporum]
IFINEVKSFIPAEQYGQSSVLVGTKLYFFGGNRGFTLLSNEVFYLDVSQSFTSEIPPWVDLTSSAAIPFGSSAAAVSLSGTKDNPNIYLIGGLMNYSSVNSPKSLLHSFNTQTLKWDIPDIKGKVPKARMLMKAIVYIGGLNIGEINGIKIVDIAEIYLYDTKSDRWEVMSAKNINKISSRFGHTAILAPDDQIIIYGGHDISVKYLVEATPNMAVLNTQTTPFEWFSPQVSSKISKVPSLVYHTANLVGNYMIVAFGNITQSDQLARPNSNIYIMNIKDFTWVNKFEPNLLSTKKIVIFAIGGIFGAALLMGLGIFIYRWYKSRNLLTSGKNISNNNPNNP